MRLITSGIRITKFCVLPPSQSPMAGLNFRALHCSLVLMGKNPELQRNWLREKWLFPENFQHFQKSTAAALVGLRISLYCLKADIKNERFDAWILLGIFLILHDRKQQSHSAQSVIVPLFQHNESHTDPPYIHSNNSLYNSVVNPWIMSLLKCCLTFQPPSTSISKPLCFWVSERYTLELWFCTNKAPNR